MAYGSIRPQSVEVGSLLSLKVSPAFSQHWKLRALSSVVQDNWEWTQVHVQPGSPQPVPRDFLGMVHLPGHGVLLFGGLDGAEKRLDDTWIFDCET